MMQKINSVAVVSTDQPQPVQLPRMLRAGGQEIDAGGVDGAVAQHVRQFHDVSRSPVERDREQVREVVRKYL